MNKTVININGKEVVLLFGMWTLARLADRGIKLKDLQVSLDNNPIECVHTILYLGACNGAGRDLNAYDEDFFWEYLDNVGIEGEGVLKAITCFGNSINQDVPDKKKPGKSKAGAKK